MDAIELNWEFIRAAAERKGEGKAAAGGRRRGGRDHRR
jgi:hypothetical protein